MYIFANFVIIEDPYVCRVTVVVRRKSRDHAAHINLLCRPY